MQGLGAIEELLVPEHASDTVHDWTLSLVEAPADAPVPPELACGLPVDAPVSVHGALIAAGLLRDVTVDGQETDALWISRARWRLRTRLERPTRPFGHAVLEFSGIDTVATVSVNGTPRATSTNMHRTLEIDVTRELSTGPVDVTVDLDPALPLAERAHLANPLPHAYDRPYNQVRKMACSFSWDWGPATMTAGLWRPVRLHLWTTARLADVRLAASPGTSASAVPGLTPTAQPGGEAPPAGHTPHLDLDVTVDGEAVSLTVHVRAPGCPGDAAPLTSATVPLHDGHAALRLDVPGARAWWPVGLGEQPLYDVTVEILDGYGTLLDRTTRRVGFRDVALVQEADGDGVSCEIHVNGRRVWVRGLNWIPDDCFPERITADRLRERVTQAVDAGANLLRVWGGGVFESDDFYDTCDTLGVLVWQDFLFACAAYPEDDATVEEVRAEAADNVRRLRHHASLTLWCGGNENLWGYEDWGWKEQLRGRPWGLGYYTEVLPEVLAELDGTRPYIPGSPFSPDSRAANASTAGAMHVWDVWNGRDYTEYEQKRPRFAAEFGWQGLASWPTLARALSLTDIDTQLAADDPALVAHQKADEGSDKLAFGLEQHLPNPPERGAAYYYATQLVQARAVRTGISHFRALHDTCSGTIWWQLNDCWPAISWALVDVGGRRKLGWYALREVYAQRATLMGGGRSDATVTLVNDTGEEWETTVAVSALSVEGREHERVHVDTVVPAHGSTRLALGEHLRPLPEDIDLLVADVQGRRSTRWLRPDLDLDLGPAWFEVEVVGGAGTADHGAPAGDDAAHQEVLVQVRALGVIRDLCLLAELECPDAVVDAQLHTLLPGETVTFRVTGPGVGRVADERWRELLWSEGRLR